MKSATILAFSFGIVNPNSSNKSFAGPEAPNVSIPNEFQKRVVTDKVGTLVQNMDVSMQGSNGKIILDQKDNWVNSLKPVNDNL